MTADITQIRKLYQEEQLGFRAVADRLGMQPWRVYRLMQQNGIPRRRGTEQNYATYKNKPQFSLKTLLTDKEERLRVAGTMLYLAEGAKTARIVDFSNCDPELIAVFMAFLRKICGVAESRLRVLVYAYEDQDLHKLIAFWSRVTRIPRSQFIKPYVRKLTPNVTKRKMSWGLVHIRYSDTRLLQLILQWGKKFSTHYSGRYLSG